MDQLPQRDGPVVTRRPPFLGMLSHGAFLREPSWQTARWWWSNSPEECAISLFHSNRDTTVDDGLGGVYKSGTFELTILEATGIYRSFEGGHNHMVDRLHFLTPGNGSGGLDEYCFCFITRP